MTMHLYTDGACSGNPGPGGWAVVQVDPLNYDVKFVKYGSKDNTTNNYMELRALLEAMLWAKEYTGDQVRIYSDSTYAVKGVLEWMKGWKKRGWRKADGSTILNPEIWMEIDKAWEPSKMSLSHVRGHSGHPGNEAADKWAVKARDKKI